MKSPRCTPWISLGLTVVPAMLPEVAQAAISEALVEGPFEAYDIQDVIVPVGQPEVVENAPLVVEPVPSFSDRAQEAEGDCRGTALCLPISDMSKAEGAGNGRAWPATHADVSQEEDIAVEERDVESGSLLPQGEGLGMRASEIIDPLENTTNEDITHSNEAVTDSRLTIPAEPEPVLIASSDIVPDGTLGTEQTVINPISDTLDRIEGGAIRGESLFHSFERFNVGEGQSAYFANPADINNIVGRVTGNTRSDIMGTLGVDGNADLYLVNPNGFVFGPEATLDVNGAFTATTANGVVLPDGNMFTAGTVDEAPLLTVNVAAPMGVEFVGERVGDIVSDATLFVGRDFALDANNLQLTGQLATNENLTLVGQDTVTIRDSDETPFWAGAGGELLIQGNDNVDIFILNHPESHLVSGEDMTFSSTNPVGGDAHYWAGGNFSIQTLDDSLGSLHSPFDPLIRARGDVIFDGYSGASLHIIAGGSVKVDGDITITEVEGSNVLPNALRNVSLSLVGRQNTSNTKYDRILPVNESYTIGVNGQEEPTLDIRAGVRDDIVRPYQLIPIMPLGFNQTNFIPDPETETDEINENPANITITGTIRNLPGTQNSTGQKIETGLILLTNTYKRNESESGSITVGDITTFGNVVIDSREDILTNGVIDTRSVVENQVIGNIFLLALDGKISVGGDLLAHVGINMEDPTNEDFSPSVIGMGGDIVLVSDDNIDLNNRSILAYSNITQEQRNDLVTNINSPVGSTVKIISTGGSVTIEGSRVSVINYADGTASDAAVPAGSVFINANDQVTIKEESHLLANGSRGQIFIGLNTGFNGQFDADRPFRKIDLSLASPSRVNISDSTVSSSNQLFASDDSSGRILIRSGSVTANGLLDSNLPNREGIISVTNSKLSTDATSNPQSSDISPSGGVVGLLAGRIIINSSTNISSATEDTSSAGNISLTATNRISIEDSQISARAAASGVPGFILIDAQDFTANNSLIQTSNFRSTSRGGNINLVIDNNLSLVDSLLAASTETGIAGNILINEGLSAVRSLNLNGLYKDDGRGGIIATANQESIAARAGNISINARSVMVSNGSQIATSNVSSDVPGNQRGDFGNINIQNAYTLTVENGLISSSTETGVAGGVTIDATESVTLDGALNNGEGGIQASANEGGIADNIIIRTDVLQVENGAEISARSRDSDSNITSQGTAGNVDITANAVTLTNQAEISTTNEGAKAPNTNESFGNVFLRSLDTLSVTDSLISSSTQSGVAGRVTVDATESITLNGTLNNGDGGIQAAALNGGSADDITITTNVLNVLNRAEISARSVDDDEGNISKGTAGNVDITANAITLNNQAEISTTNEGARAPNTNESFGNISLRDVDTLSITNSSIAASTQAGVAGGVNIQNTNSQPVNSVSLTNSVIEARASRANGEAGGVEINTNTLNLNNSEIQSSNVSGTNNDGNITLTNINTLTATNSLISASTRNGIAGNIQINENQSAAQSVILSSTNQNIDNDEAFDGGIVAIATNGGSAGNIGVNTRVLTINNGAEISVSSETGSAGNVTINATEAILDQGQINAVTGQDSAGANINLRLPRNSNPEGHLILNNDSLISARALGNATGGNITIEARHIRANGSNNGNGPNGSDIIARASEGNGGRINITADGSIINLEERPAVDGNYTNDIDASSDFGSPGQVNLNTIGDPSSGLTTLPETPVQTEVASSCQAAASSTEAIAFFDIGRGGSRSTPDDSLNSDTGLNTWIVLPEMPTPTFSVRQTVHAEGAKEHQTTDVTPEELSLLTDAISVSQASCTGG